MLKLGRTSELLCETIGRSQPVLMVNIAFSTLSTQRLIERYPNDFKKLVAALARQKARLLIYGVADPITAEILFEQGVKFVAKAG